MKKQNSHVLKILLLITVSILVIFINNILFARHFYVNADQIFQYNIFYQEWLNLLTDFFVTGESPFYSWNTFLGTDYYSSMQLYVTGDIFMPLLFVLYYFNGVGGLELGLFIETIICIYISALSMYLFLKEFGIKKSRSLIFIPIVYALSGWACLLYGQYMYFRFYAFMPLMFYGFEYFINKKKSYIFIISVTLLFISNYYFMFSASIFLFIYGIFTLKNRGFSNKKIFIYFIKLLLRYLVGLLLALFLILPSIITILSNPRIGTHTNSIRWEWRSYIGFIVNWIVSPYPIYTNFDSIFYAGDNGHQAWYSLFIGIIPLLSALKLAFNKNYKKYTTVLISLLLILLVPQLSSIMHGFSEPTFRWTFILLFFVLLMSAKQLDLEDLKFNKIMYIYCLIFILSLLVCYMIGDLKENHIVHLISIFIFFISGLIIYIVFNKNNKLGIILSIIQLVLSAGFMQSQFSVYRGGYEDTINIEHVQYQRSLDKDVMYRYAIDNSILAPGSILNLNMSLKYDYMGISTYNSYFERANQKFLDFTGNGWHSIELDDPYLYPMLGVKYIMVTRDKPDELPDIYNYEYVYDFNYLDVYSYEGYKGFGFTTNKYDYFKNIKESKQFTDTIFIDDNNYDINKLNNEYDNIFDILDRTNNTLSGSVTANGKGLLYIPIPNNKGWTLRVNEKQQDIISVNGGFIGIEINEGNNNIELRFRPIGLSTGIILSCIGFIIFIIVILLERKNNRVV